MIISDDLFQLIHSMDQGEKWYFKRYADRLQKGKEKNYIRLFEAIEKQSEYNEAALIKRFSGKGFVRQFSVAKNYLHQLIMESLTLYHQKNSVRHQALRMIHGVEILSQKGLFGQAGKHLRKARKLIKGHHLLHEELRLIHWEHDLAGYLLPPHQTAKRYDLLDEQERQLMNDYQRDREYVRLGTKWTNMMVQLGVPRNKQERAAYNPLLRHPLMQDNVELPTPAARPQYYFLKQSMYWMLGKFEEVYKIARQELKDIEADRTTQRKRPSIESRYVKAIYRVLIASVDLRLYDDYFEKKFRLLRSIATESQENLTIEEEAKVASFSAYYAIELEMRNDRALFDGARELISEIEEALPAIQHKISPLILAEKYFFMGQYLFAAGYFNDALRWFNEYINHPQTPQKKDQYAWAKIMCLIIHYELRHESQLEYNIKTTYYYLSKLTRLFKTEKKLLQFFKREMPKIHDEETLIKALKKFLASLKKLQDDPFEQRVLKNFDLISWLESRIQGRPLPEIIKEKVKNGKAG